MSPVAPQDKEPLRTAIAALKAYAVGDQVGLYALLTGTDDLMALCKALIALASSLSGAAAYPEFAAAFLDNMLIGLVEES